MKVRYISRGVPPYDNWEVALHVERYVRFSITHPMTGNRFGVEVRDGDGGMLIASPPFFFGVFSDIVRENNVKNMYDLVPCLYGLHDRMHKYAMKHYAHHFSAITTE